MANGRGRGGAGLKGAMRLDWERLLSTERRVPCEKIKGDRRSEFQRDYDRALFSTPVRRLQDKAQVFPLEAHDAIRTRLTHSLEASSIARTLGRNCAPFIIEIASLRDDAATDIEMVCQTCGLLHDVGNPPFGHAGEKAIAEWFGSKLKSDKAIERQIRAHPSDGHGRQRLLDFRKFDGNPQTFRILTRLQLVDNYAGLNLTFGTLATLLKYAAPSDRTNSRIACLKKHGHFCSENEIVEHVRKVTGLGELRHPLTYLVEAADDIAYSVVDIEDALKKRVISWALLRTEEFAPLHRYVKRAMKAVGTSEAMPRLEKPDIEQAWAIKLRGILITEMVDSIVRAFVEQYPRIMNGRIDRALERCCDRGDVIEACKNVTKRYVYFAKDTLKLEIMGKKVVSDLLDLFWEGVVGYDSSAGSFHFPNKVWEMLSTNYRHIFERELDLRRVRTNGKMDYYAAFHLVADYVCGMTDTFACRLHRELFNAN